MESTQNRINAMPAGKTRVNNQQNFASSGVNGRAAVSGAEAIDGNQWRKWHTMQGHGFAAEDANALHDTLCGRRVEKVGVSNELNGPDRIVNGVKVQTKYCQSASASVNAAFRNPDGSYAYSGQRLEVPSDQYEEALRLMAEKIRAGKVPGVTDPAQASSMVQKGSVTYRQARNIARAGNVDSVWFDVKTQAVNCVYSAGLSFVIAYATARYRGETPKKALNTAAKQAGTTALTTTAVGVVTQQTLRVLTREGSRQATNAAVASASRSVAQQVARSAMRTNAITGTVMAVTSVVPDVVRYSQGKISGQELARRSAGNVAGVGGGMAAASWGAAAGTAILPGVGTVIGGIIGGMVGGIASSALVKKIFG